MTSNERFLTLEKSELIEVRKLHESTIGIATKGIFYKQGQMIGNRIFNECVSDIRRTFEILEEYLKSAGWVRDVKFYENTVVVKGSIEQKDGDKSTCDTLRGIFSQVYENYLGIPVFCREAECESTGKEMCIFEIVE